MDGKAEFVFRMSNFNDPRLMDETAELLRQRLEAKSRRTAPWVWKVTDKLNDRPKADSAVQVRRRKRYRIYGVLLIALGVFALVPGLMEPRVPGLIWAGGWAIFAGLFSFYPAKERKPLAPPASCKKEAAALLKSRRETDWEALRAEVRFDETGWFVKTAGGGSRTAYEALRGAFETERLWLLVDEKEQALLLQRKDLASGAAKDFLPFLRARISGGSAA